MGARASVILRQRKQESPVLCQHWGGSEFHDNVKQWIEEVYKEDHTQDNLNPSNRLEPGRLFIKLVQKFGKGGYVARTRDEVDDSDYGCLYVELGKEPEFSI